MCAKKKNSPAQKHTSEQSPPQQSASSAPKEDTPSPDATAQDITSQQSTSPATFDGAPIGDGQPPHDGQSVTTETPETAQFADSKRSDEEHLFPVVGIGASAGGIEAFVELLKHLPADTGMAFVFVQHLDPRHRSNLSDILSHHTKIRVCEIRDGMPLERNCIYVVPAGSELGMFHGSLQLIPRPESAERFLPIDRFFRSLAEDQGPNAIAVLLSGTGTDGALGLRSVKAEGGITITQDPQTAKYGGMPSSPAAVDVDLVLSPREIATELARLGTQPQLIRRFGAKTALLEPTEDLQKIFILLRRASGVDFSLYKQSTVARRIHRRMLLHKIESVKDYLRYIQQVPGEIGVLFEEMLINVTGFFRDSDVFEALKTSVFPKLIESRGSDDPIRIWVPACSTGEEAYSLAIALIEYLGPDDMRRPIQIFATDVSDQAVEKARSGRYPENISQDISPERLRRFFTKTESGFQISKMIRDMCVVAKQNVVKDPPFSNLDLISCRNLLIYMGASLQHRLIPTFHYALRSTGFLLLGSSETIGTFSDLFALCDKKHKIYAKKSSASRLPADFGAPDVATPPATPEKRTEPQRSASFDLEREADRIVLERFAPPGVIIDEHMNILQFRGKTGRFLEPSPGQASLNLLRLAKEGLVFDIRAAVHRAKREGTPVRKEGIRIGHNGGQVDVNLEIIPIVRGEHDEAQFLVVFDEPPSQSPSQSSTARSASRKQAKNDANQELEAALNELTQTKETLRTIIEQHEATNEELRAANEEIQSSNEELQSTNEELETAKEELQSTNEELTTLNEELENRNAELSRIINDYNNLLASADIPIIMFDVERRIRLFTPMATTVFNLIPADQGRPISALSLGGQIAELEAKVADVIDHLTTKDEEIALANGRWYTMRLRPYKTAENRIEGAVMSLFDVTETRLARQRDVEQRALRRALALAEGILATLRKPFVVLDSQLHILSANRAFYDAFEIRTEEMLNQPIFALSDGRWEIPRLRYLLEQVIPHDTPFQEFLVEQEFPRVGSKRLLLAGQRIDLRPEQPDLILLTMEDVTDEPRPGAGPDESPSTG